MYTRRDKLTGTERLIDVSENVAVKEDPVIQYNHVVECYNSDENRILTYYMQEMSFSSIYNKIWRVISNPCTLLMLILSTAVPLLGAFTYILMLYSFIHYFRGLAVYRANKSQVPDPFQNMVFCPDLCRAENVVNKFYEIQGKDLEGFSFNREIKNSLKTKEFQGRIRFMVYDSRFWDYFYNYPKYKLRHIMTLILGTAMVILQLYIINVMCYVNNYC